MRPRFRLLIVWLLVAAFAAGVPAGTLEAALATPCAAAQADDCCGSGGSPDAGCTAHCAASCAPILALAAPAPAARPQAALTIAFVPPERQSLARAPEAAPPRPFLV
jgi:hypothetical protein